MRLVGNGRSANIAYPNEPEAVDWFAVMMKKAAPRMAKDDLKLLEASLRTPKK